MTRPVKAELPRYKQIEEPLQAVIWSKWLNGPLSEEELAQVFAIDDEILAHEFIVLMDHKITDPTPPIASQPEFSFTGFEQCQQAFLDLFHRLSEE